LTLKRLAKEQAGTPAVAAEKLLAEFLGSLRLAERELPAGWNFAELRGRLDAAIARLR
jgi:hypothetical protein